MEQVLVILRRRKWLFIIPFTVVFLIPVIHAYLYARSYEADSTVWLDSDLGASSAVRLQSGSQKSTQMSPEWNQTASERAEQELETYEIVKKMHELDCSAPLERDTWQIESQRVYSREERGTP